VLNRPEVRALVIAGDLCEDATGGALLPALLHELTKSSVELTGVVPGNHDRDMARSSHGLPLRPEGILLGEWLVVHGDGPLSGSRLVHGHFHPCIRWAGGRAAPCYLIAPGRIVLPAFSADAAGVDVRWSADWHGYSCCAIADTCLLNLGDVSALRSKRRAGGSASAG
jgi:metallophosphoesterase superfamily enzyme